MLALVALVVAYPVAVYSLYPIYPELLEALPEHEDLGLPPRPPSFVVGVWAPLGLRAKEVEVHGVVLYDRARGLYLVEVNGTSYIAIPLGRYGPPNGPHVLAGETVMRRVLGERVLIKGLVMRTRRGYLLVIREILVDSAVFVARVGAR